jgi:hypothetical protein
MLDNVKIIDGFVWLIVTDVAEKVFYSNALQIFRLYPDGTEALIMDFRDLQKALEHGDDLAVEIGSLSGLNDAYAYQSQNRYQDENQLHKLGYQ